MSSFDRLTSSARSAVTQKIIQHVFDANVAPVCAGRSTKGTVEAYEAFMRPISPHMALSRLRQHKTILNAYAQLRTVSSRAAIIRAIFIIHSTEP
jgi:hypothetical protein